MKKTTILFVFGAIFAISIFAGPQGARAADGASAITPEQAATLKTALDILGKTLDILEARVAEELVPEAQISPTKQTLGTLRGSLVALNTLLVQGGASAFAVETGKTLPAETSVTNVPVDAGSVVVGMDKASQAESVQTASLFDTVKTRKGRAAAVAVFLVLGALCLVGVEYFRHRVRPLRTI
ncbi:MAG: hypothetical protein AAB495_03435 [Patescibacteria group bacterium]